MDSTDAKSQPIICESAQGLTFLWLEFLDPKDGIVFASEVTSPSKLPRWSNITDLAAPPYSKKIEPFPQRASVQVISIKKTPDYTGYLCKQDGRLGSVMYASRINKDLEPINMEIFSNPKLVEGQGGPNVYIISGHGVQGRVYGVGYPAGEIYLSELKPDNNLRVIILACCNNGVRSRMATLSKFFSGDSLLAIFGFSGRYPGGDVGKAIFSSFGRMIRSSPDRPLREMWAESTKNGDKKTKAKNGNDVIVKCEWAAAFAKGAENMTPRDLAFPNRLTIDRNVPARYYFVEDPDVGVELIFPYIDGFFVFSLNYKTEEDLNQTIKDYEKPTLMKYLEDNYLKVAISYGMNFLVLRTDLKGRYKKFKKGDSFLVKFFVVRTTWPHPIDISKIFKISKEQPFARCNVTFPFGETSDCLKITITEECTSIKIGVVFCGDINNTEQLGKYLLERATKDNFTNPWDLNFALAKINTESTQELLPDGSVLNIETLKRFSWSNKEVQDLRIYPNRIEVIGAGTTRGPAPAEF